MCIIAIKKKGVELPDDSIFRNCFFNNSDGAGFMYNKGGKVIIKKGYMRYADFKTALSDALKDIEDVVNTGMVFHFRISTQGGTNPQNCHPFPISNRDIDLQSTYFETEMGIAHNGVIDLTTTHSYSGWDNKTKKWISRDSHLSDTQLFIRDYLYGIYKLNREFYRSKEGMKMIEKLIGSKMCFLTPDGEIRTIGAFNEKDGMLYSNYTYSYDKFTTRTFSSYSGYSGYSGKTTMPIPYENYYDDYYDYYEDAGYYTYNAYKDNNKVTTSDADKEKAVAYHTKATTENKPTETDLGIREVRLMPLGKECYYWGTSNEGQVITEPEFYAVDSSGVIYSIEEESMTAFQESNGYVFLFDYDGNSIDYDDSKANVYEDMTYYCG